MGNESIDEATGRVPLGSGAGHARLDPAAGTDADLDPAAGTDADLDPAAGTDADLDPAAGTDADLDPVEEELAGVELALARLDEGTYGRCEMCGSEIEVSLLADAPTARHCRSHLPLALS